MKEYQFPPAVESHNTLQQVLHTLLDCHKAGASETYEELPYHYKNILTKKYKSKLFDLQ